MAARNLHSWEVSPKEAVRIQAEVVRPEVRVSRLPRKVRLVAGGDCAFDKADGHAHAAWVLWDADAGEVVERAWATVELTFPYVPGLLTFREGPALLAAWQKLRRRGDVDLLMFDGQGLAHPRRCGLATHMGVWMDLPSIGVAKSRLCGEVAGEPGRERGQSTDLVDGGELIGKVLRTRDGVRPLFVSIGHRVTLDDAVRLTLACGRGYRLPEPTRQADRLVGQVKRGEV